MIVILRTSTGTKGFVHLVLGLIRANPMDKGQSTQFFDTRPTQPDYKSIVWNVTKQFGSSPLQFFPPGRVEPSFELDQVQPGHRAVVCRLSHSSILLSRLGSDAFIPKTDLLTSGQSRNSASRQQGKEDPAKD